MTLVLLRLFFSDCPSPVLFSSLLFSFSSLLFPFSSLLFLFSLSSLFFFFAWLSSQPTQPLLASSGPMPVAGTTPSLYMYSGQQLFPGMPHHPSAVSPAVAAADMQRAWVLQFQQQQHHQQQLQLQTLQQQQALQQQAYQQQLLQQQRLPLQPPAPQQQPTPQPQQKTQQEPRRRKSKPLPYQGPDPFEQAYQRQQQLAAAAQPPAPAAAPEPKPAAPPPKQSTIKQAPSASDRPTAGTASPPAKAAADLPPAVLELLAPGEDGESESESEADDERKCILCQQPGERLGPGGGRLLPLKVSTKNKKGEWVKEEGKRKEVMLITT